MRHEVHWLEVNLFNLILGCCLGNHDSTLKNNNSSTSLLPWRYSVTSAWAKVSTTKAGHSDIDRNTQTWTYPHKQACARTHTPHTVIHTHTHRQTVAVNTDFGYFVQCLNIMSKMMAVLCNFTPALLPTFCAFVYKRIMMIVVIIMRKKIS